IPPPDLAISGRTVGARVQTLAKGTAVEIPLAIHNIGYQPADSVRIRVDRIGSGGVAQPIHYATAGPVPVDSFSTVNLSIPSDGLTGYNLLAIAVSPPARARDLLAENNHAQVLVNFTGNGETLSATIRMYADGVPLMDGDYVSSRPQFLVQFEDLVGIKPGEERVRLWADNQLVESQAKAGAESDAAWPGPGNDIVRNGYHANLAEDPGTAAPATASTTGAGVGTTPAAIATADGFIFNPQLSNGPHELVVRLYRVDSLAGLDSLESRIAVQVVSELRLMRVYNYPNPFSSSTEFTFVLSGARPPEGLTIRIFTITGRRIQEIYVPPTDLRVGFNRIWWDGRDRDGDEIANGYYFYKIQGEGEGKVETAIEKMAKVR
ncbi:MAG: hypothetical protein IT282_00055, partial [Bacteroidetes bacterium]|nr:hypothetical protein [Bacteroidota bacterium]